MAFSVNCPHCGAILKSAAAVPAGKKVKCPKCSNTFATPSLEEAGAVSTAPLPPRTPGTEAEVPEADVPMLAVDEDPEEPDEEDEPRRRKKDRDVVEEDDEPRGTRKPRRKKAGKSAGLIVGLIVGG